MTMKQYLKSLETPIVMREDPETYLRRKLKDTRDTAKRFEKHAAFLEKALRAFLTQKKGRAV